ncbi:MAG: phosphoribosyltransferase family protein [Bacteroidetes bacterium]|nr:phosphoribosyltransferase family protein [Bacteroidota bacterium]
MKTQVLDSKQISKMIKRMAYQIYESNFSEKELILVGISGQGYELAKLIQTELEGICSIKIQLTQLDLNKSKPEESLINIMPDNIKYKNKSIIVIDDVLNTGKTLIYSCLPFLKWQVKKLQVAVLVDRNHKNFPISADFIGISLSTTLQEHIHVVMEKKKFNVYLE